MTTEGLGSLVMDAYPRYNSNLMQNAQNYATQAENLALQSMQNIGTHAANLYNQASSYASQGLQYLSSIDPALLDALRCVTLGAIVVIVSLLGNYVWRKIAEDYINGPGEKALDPNKEPLFSIRFTFPTEKK